MNALARKSTRSDARKASTRATIASAGAIEQRRAELSEREVGYVVTRKLRTLALVALLLRERDGLAVEELRVRCGVSRATLYRMRDDITAAGLPLVITERGGVGVWSLDVG
jgi:hypothetical protein